MGALQTFIEIAEGTVQILNVVRERSDRIRVREEGAPPPPPSRYGRGKDPSKATSMPTASTPHPDPTDQTPSHQEPTIEVVTDADSGTDVWIVSSRDERVECYSARAAEKVRDALR